MCAIFYATPAFWEKYNQFIKGEIEIPGMKVIDGQVCRVDAEGRPIEFKQHGEVFTYTSGDDL